MSASRSRSTALWTILSDELDIPRTLYTQAVARHKSLGEWLCRRGSALADFGPRVNAQGGFRYGTVVKPIHADAEYDLDNVVVLEKLRAGSLTQADLKARFGAELDAYAVAHGMQPATEKKRCWRLHYRDEVGFHLDSLPCVPAGEGTQETLRRAGVPESWLMRAVAITDQRHPQYRVITQDWFTSNPRGFARWFESRASLGRDAALLEQIRMGTVEPVPAYEWKTPLQRCIQILKRHRDVHFVTAPTLAPISMIITNLAAHAYQGQRDVTDALLGIVRRMPEFVRAVAPFVPNPTHPAEDYADKWTRDERLPQNFWAWHQQVLADVERLSAPLSRIESADIERRFRVPLTAEDASRLELGAPAVFEAPAPRIVSAPAPWGAVPQRRF